MKQFEMEEPNYIEVEEGETMEQLFGPRGELLDGILCKCEHCGEIFDRSQMYLVHTYTPCETMMLCPECADELGEEEVY